MSIEQLRNIFFEQTCYSSADVLAWNPTTGKFVTKNGGVYQVKGNEVIHLGGPSPDPEDRL